MDCSQPAMLGVSAPMYWAKIPPAIPAKNAEIAKTSTFIYVTLMPDALAAISSSRMALTARPYRERANMNSSTTVTTVIQNTTYRLARRSMPISA